MYTFFLNYKNVISVKQSNGNSLTEAVENWIPALENTQFGKGDDKSSLDLNELKSELKDSRFVQLKGLQNVWSNLVVLGGKNAIVNVVLTQEAFEDEDSLSLNLN